MVTGKARDEREIEREGGGGSITLGSGPAAASSWGDEKEVVSPSSCIAIENCVWLELAEG